MRIYYDRNFTWLRRNYFFIGLLKFGDRIVFFFFHFSEKIWMIHCLLSHCYWCGNGVWRIAYNFVSRVDVAYDESIFDFWVWKKKYIYRTVCGQSIFDRWYFGEILFESFKFFCISNMDFTFLFFFLRLIIYNWLDNNSLEEKLLHQFLDPLNKDDLRKQKKFMIIKKSL